MLMRKDIAFIEAAYGAMRLDAYAVPVNWHFKPEEIDFDVLRTLYSASEILPAFAGKTK
jgi:acyl-CoA synthetase (AMP-forming)/AMP-acid ligase II